MKKVLFGIFGLGLLALCGYTVLRRRKACNTMEAVWVSSIPVDEGREEKSVTELERDVNQAIDEMDLEDEEEFIISTDDYEAVDFEKMYRDEDQVLMDGMDVLRKANAMLGNSEENRREAEELAKKIEEMKNREKEREEKKLDEDIQRAISSNNLSEMFRLFERKYAYAPIGMTASEAFGYAKGDGLITDEIYQAAYERYKRIWNYAGD